MNDQQDTISEDAKNEIIESNDPGILKRIIKNRFSHVRAGWRMSAFLIIATVVALPAGNFLQKMRESSGAAQAIFSPWRVGGDLINIISLLISAFILFRWIDKRPFGVLGLSFTPGWFKEFKIGIVMGFGLLTFMFLLLWITGINDVAVGEMNLDVLKTLSGFLIIFIFAGIFEEILTRGYLLQALSEGSRPWIAMVVFSLIFSLLHLTNPNFSYAGAINIFLGGILLSVAYFETRSLWLPTGLHIAWNWTQGPLWGMNVSGIEIENTFLISTPVGPEWLSGGAFGAEGSYLISIAIIALTWYIYKAEWIKPSEANVALWEKYPAGFGMEPIVAEESNDQEQ